jgi:hypothetical protein
MADDVRGRHRTRVFSATNNNSLLFKIITSPAQIAHFFAPKADFDISPVATCLNIRDFRQQVPTAAPSAARNAILQTATGRQQANYGFHQPM